MKSMKKVLAAIVALCALASTSVFAANTVAPSAGFTFADNVITAANPGSATQMTLTVYDGAISAANIQYIDQVDNSAASIGGALKDVIADTVLGAGESKVFNVTLGYVVDGEFTKTEGTLTVTAPAAPVVPTVEVGTRAQVTGGFVWTLTINDYVLTGYTYSVTFTDEATSETATKTLVIGDVEGDVVLDIVLTTEKEDVTLDAAADAE